jgi:hypothetical protein
VKWDVRVQGHTGSRCGEEENFDLAFVLRPVDYHMKERRIAKLWRPVEV